MIAVDTNILIHAHRGESKHHAAATEAMNSLLAGTAPWCIPMHCMHEFIGVVTHQKVFSLPTTLDRALDQIDYWMTSPMFKLVWEDEDYRPVAEHLFKKFNVKGPSIHDARIAAVCVRHGVSELWAADRDFMRYSELNIVNPLDNP